MNKHSRQQQLMVLSAYNKKLDNPHLNLWIKKKIIGQDLRLSQSLSKLPEPSGTSQDLFEQVYIYINEQDIKGLDSMFGEYQATFDTYEDWEEVYDELQTHINFILT